jgi:hypothetical protein
MSNKICDQLQTKYCAPDAAVFFEVPNATGSIKSRSADAIAMELWPSRGLAITGFEFKCSRTDWLKELKDASKAHAFWKHCDYWYLVVTDKAIVRPGELPLGWGLMVSQENGLRTLTQSTKNPDPIINRNFLAGMIRAAGKCKDRLNATAMRREYQRGLDEGRQLEAKSDKNLMQVIEKLQGKIRKFEEGFGVQLDSWEFRHGDPKRIGELVKQAINGGLDPDLDRLKFIRTQAQQIIDRTDTILAGGK